MKTKILTVTLISVFITTILKADIPVPDHILIVIMENHGYNQIIGSSQAPYINSLTNDPNGALFTNSHGLTHPSQPNYLMFYSGSNQGVTNDNLPTNLPFLTLNLGESLLYEGKTFTGYSEDLPYVGYNGVSYGNYVRKHNPWVNWQNSPTHGVPQSVNQPYTAFPLNYDSLPSISFVIPNMIHDMHDGTIQQGDTWLRDNLNSYVNWAKTHNSLFILTFDEDNFTVPNQIPTIFVGESVLHGQYSDYITHYNILRTFEDMYGLPHSVNTSNAAPITNCWLMTNVTTSNTVPSNCRMEQNYPNPFNPATTIKYHITSVSEKNPFVRLNVYDILGNKVADLVHESEPAGDYAVKFGAISGSEFNLPSGIYFYELTVDGNAVDTKRMTLLK